jgi:hypothetical protein
VRQGRALDTSSDQQSSPAGVQAHGALHTYSEEGAAGARNLRCSPKNAQGPERMGSFAGAEPAFL